MRLNSSLIASACLGGILLVAACTTDYQQGKGDVTYGDSDSLANKVPPGTTSQVTADGGDTTSTPSSTAVCVTAGGTLAAADGGTCAVLFSTAIMPIFATAGCDSTSCHGGPTPLNQPPINTKDAKSTWTSFQAYTMNAGGLQYINPCSTDETMSGMDTNFNASPSATGGSHMPQGGQLAAADITTIQTWLKCGSPNN